VANLSKKSPGNLPDAVDEMMPKMQIWVTTVLQHGPELESPLAPSVMGAWKCGGLCGPSQRKSLPTQRRYARRQVREGRWRVPVAAIEITCKDGTVIRVLGPDAAAPDNELDKWMKDKNARQT
jgi:hypothetical protein